VITEEAVAAIEEVVVMIEGVVLMKQKVLTVEEIVVMVTEADKPSVKALVGAEVQRRQVQEAVAEEAAREAVMTM